jgi:hypothetical protein
VLEIENVLNKFCSSLVSPYHNVYHCDNITNILSFQESKNYNNYPKFTAMFFIRKTSGFGDKSKATRAIYPKIRRFWG